MSTLYEKRGRRYVAVADDRKFDVLPFGINIIIVHDHGRSYHFNIKPDNALLAAAALAKRGKICTAIMKGLDMRPRDRKVSPRQAAAWSAFKKAMGNDSYLVEYKSVAEICNDVIVALTQE